MNVTTRRKLARAVKRFLPAPLVGLGKRAVGSALLAQARSALRKAPAGPAWLDESAFESLRKEFPPLASTEAPSASVTDEQPDFASARVVIDALKPASTHALLEIGGGFGLCAAAVRKQLGCAVTVVDLEPIASRVATELGVTFHPNTDAAKLPFADSTFDAAWSFNAFEHIDDPEASLREAIRVVKPGGTIYLDFGPLYRSPWGLHAYREIGIPYCQLLFPAELIRKHVSHPDLWHLNGWSLSQWRALFTKLSPTLKPVRMSEDRDVLSLKMIRRFPSCFRAKSDDVDEFVVTQIRAVFRVQK